MKSSSGTAQGLFPEVADLPEGFRYKPELIDARHEQSIIARMRDLEFAPFQFHGFEGKRRVISYGWMYDFNGGGHRTGSGDSKNPITRSKLERALCD